MRVLLHAHTTYSHDGRLQPIELAELAKQKGFEAVLLSDHYEDLDRETYGQLVAECNAIKTCMLIPGYERNWSGYHICAFGVNCWVDDGTLQTWASRVRDAGGILCLVHPVRYQHVVPQEILVVCDAVEVWNSKRPYEGLLGPSPEAFSLLGKKSSHRRLAFVGQDIHRSRDATRCGLIVPHVETASELLDALRQGEFRPTARFLSSVEKLPGFLQSLLRGMHRLRRWMWVPPLRAYYALRWVRRRFGIYRGRLSEARRR